MKSSVVARLYSCRPSDTVKTFCWPIQACVQRHSEAGLSGLKSQEFQEKKSKSEVVDPDETRYPLPLSKDYCLNGHRLLQGSSAVSLPWFPAWHSLQAVSDCRHALIVVGRLMYQSVSNGPNGERTGATEKACCHSKT